MRDKNNISEDNKIFKIKGDGTIVQEEGTDNSTQVKKSRNGWGITGFILSMFALISFIIIVVFLAAVYANAHFELPIHANPNEWKQVNFSNFSEWSRDFNGFRTVFLFSWISLFVLCLFSTIFSIIGIFKKPRWIAGIVMSTIVLLLAIFVCTFYYSELAYYTVYTRHR
jgi:magnesium-transporting ATPase (P-type)